MSQTPQMGENRTSFAATGRLGEQMLEATREFLPSSPGTAQAIAEVRVSYARAGETLGETPPPLGVTGKAKAAVTAVTGGQPTLLMDKLGERLAFERAGARLYEALLSKHEAYGSFPGGPEAQDILHILQEEYEHTDLLQQAIKAQGGDPTTVSPSANLAMNISAGLPQVLSDPRTNLLQSLEAMLVAELADNDCWSALATLARQAGHEDLAAQCQEAITREREHLENVRRWIATGQGRDPDAVEGAPPPGADDEFTFAADSEEEAASKTPRKKKSSSSRSSGKSRRSK